MRFYSEGIGFHHAIWIVNLGFCDYYQQLSWAPSKAQAARLRFETKTIFWFINSRIKQFFSYKKNQKWPRNRIDFQNNIHPKTITHSKSENDSCFALFFGASRQFSQNLRRIAKSWSKTEFNFRFWRHGNYFWIFFLNWILFWRLFHCFFASYKVMIIVKS